MKKVVVQYVCDECGNKTFAYESLFGHESQWRRINFSGLKGSDVSADVRHACSYACARKILADMVENLRENDDRTEDGSD